MVAADEDDDPSAAPRRPAATNNYTQVHDVPNPLVVEDPPPPAPEVRVRAAGGRGSGAGGGGGVLELDNDACGYQQMIPLVPLDPDETTDSTGYLTAPRFTRPPRKSSSLLAAVTKAATSGDPPPRETWDKKVEFLLAVIGFAVDLGNVWRFPYICYANGGGAFLIPYCIMLVFGGMPLFYMELALGQFHRCGCLTLWKKICPALKGVGYAICLIDIYVGMHYNTIIGWALYYLVESFQYELPWTSCNNTWNTPNCTPIMGEQQNYSSSPAKEFFERSVLEQHLSDGLDRMGPIKWSLALCVFGVFVLVYFSLWKGVRSTGKAVWVTALAPYVVLFILLARGVTLPGADVGIKYYLTPQWEKLKESKVWIDAASQIFFSLGPGFGTLLALASYNKFNNNCYRDAILTSSINCLTSFLAGFVIFSVLGYMAHVQNKSVAEVGLDGPGLVFIVYPEAIATMRGSVFWSIIFFLMLITLGLDSTFGGLEAMITALCDEYPRLLGRHREIFVAVVLVFVYVCSLPTCTYGGVFLVNLLNEYGPGKSILFVVFVEAAGVCWFYGADRFSRDIEKMLGFRPGIFWRVCWTCISPVFILVIFICSLMGDSEDENKYPPWAISLGWTLTASSLVCIPIYIIYKFSITSGTFTQRVKLILRPEENPEETALSALSVNSTTYVTHGPATHGPAKYAPFNLVRPFASQSFATPLSRAWRGAVVGALVAASRCWRRAVVPLVWWRAGGAGGAGGAGAAGRAAGGAPLGAPRPAPRTRHHLAALQTCSSQRDEGQSRRQSGSASPHHPDARAARHLQVHQEEEATHPAALGEVPQFGRTRLSRSPGATAVEHRGTAASGRRPGDPSGWPPPDPPDEVFRGAGRGGRGGRGGLRYHKPDPSLPAVPNEQPLHPAAADTQGWRRGWGTLTTLHSATDCCKFNLDSSL